DETLPGPWEWDVKRLTASMLIAAQDNGFPVKDQEQIVLDTVAEYRTAMAGFAAMKILDVWYAQMDIETTLEKYASEFKPHQVKRTERRLAKARTRNSMPAFSKLTRWVDGKPRIVSEPPLIVPIDELAEGRERDEMFEELHEHLRSFRASLPYARR